MYFLRVLLSEGDVLARFGHALSDPTRAKVLLALRDAPQFPSALAETMGVSRQSMSNHLTCLRGCGLVVAVPQGRRQRYELADARLAHALSDLLGLILIGEPGHDPLRTDSPDRTSADNDHREAVDDLLAR